MKLIEEIPKKYFNILYSTKRSQLAEMVLSPGQSTGGPNNVHQNSDQWLIVVKGKGRAKVQEKEINLSIGNILVIEAGETHEIINEGKEPLMTFNIYAPTEY